MTDSRRTASEEVLDEQTRRQRNQAVLTEFVDGISSRDASRFLAVWREDASWEFPFGAGARRMQSKQEIEEFIIRFFTTFKRVALINTVIYPALDADLFFAEYDGDMEIAATGKFYRNKYIARFRFVNGELLSVCEYFNPNIVAEAFAD